MVTTVTEATSSMRGAHARTGFLVWLFPQPHSVDLSIQGERRIGRDKDSEICLSGNDVSRRHAVLRRASDAAKATLVDLGSRNGIRVNGRRVPSAELDEGDVIRVGGWVGVISSESGDFGEIVPGLWGGKVLAAAIAPLRHAATSDLPIILEGETGTGKEVAARGLHALSGRVGPFVAVNCAALPEGLAEGELFGYRRGAFTGADRTSLGLFRSADGGTLLLDEVADLHPAVQAKLLRVLEQREVLPLGETRPVRIDARFVVACQHPLRGDVAAGRFRADLLGRLDGLTVRLPALRERRPDILPLLSHFLRSLASGWVPTLETPFVERLCLYDWPFNVRELLLQGRRLATLFRGESTLLGQHLPERIGEQALSAPAPADASLSTSTDPVELPALISALRSSGGNVARAAAMMGITRQRAYRLMEAQAVDLQGLRKQGDPPP
jgi:transcriptional regulator of acetoin/glycerol metabolism